MRARVSDVTGAERSWRVSPKVPAGKAATAVIVLAAAAVTLRGSGEWWQYAVAAAAAAGLLGWAARDLVAPVRLAADPGGLTVVTGFAARHRLDWSRVERIRVDARRRSRMLEVDTGDQLYLFSRYDLDDDLDQAAAELASMKAQAAR